MKYIIAILFITSVGSIIAGFILKPDVISDKLIGSGVVGLFIFVIPLFTYHRWKNRKVNDYMLTKENIILNSNYVFL